MVGGFIFCTQLVLLSGGAGLGSPGSSPLVSPSDISGGPVSVDVGLCRSHCGAAGGSSQARGLQEQSWSILDFLRSKKVG